MHSMPQIYRDEAIQALSLTQMLSIVFLIAGGILFLRVLERWRCGAWPRPSIETSIRRLQARPWQPLDAVVLLLAILLPTLLNGIQPAGVLPASVQIAPALLFYGIILGGVLAAGQRTGLGVVNALGLSRQTLGPSLRTGLVLGLAALPPVILTAWLSEWALHGLGFSPSHQAVFDTLADPHMDAVTQASLVFVAVVVAPCAEEAIFRGVLFPALLRNSRLFLTLLLVNILFALLHLHLPSFLPLLMVGLCFSFGMLSTGSLLTPIVMHAIFNGEMLLLFYAWPMLAS